MEEKKKSSFGKAFSRTFSRKSHQAPPPTSPVAAAKPIEKPVEKQPVVVESVPSNGALASAAPVPVVAAATNPISPISIPTPTMSPPESTVTSPTFTHDTSPKLPQSHSMHARDGTGLSNASTMSHHGLSGEAGEGLNPADILLNRLIAFKGVVKNLQQYFTEITEVETGVSKAMNKASGVLVVPFKDGQQFLGKGGFQDVCVGLRDSAKTNSEQHASAARFVEETIVKNLRRLKQDIKGKIKALKADTSLYNNKVFKEREATQERIANLAKAIGLMDMSGQHQHDMEKMQSDPYVINISLKRQLAKQVHEENLFARALKQCQDEIKTFEAHIIQETKRILSSFAEYQLANASTIFSQSWAPTQEALNILQEDTEWNNFLGLHGHRLFPSELVDANPDDLDYPCKDSPYVQPLKTAHLSRQSSVLKNWKDGYFVLTLAGWLHVFGSADQEKDAVPDHSIYIPTSTLGQHSEAGQKQHVFSLDGKGKGGLLHRDAQTFTLRAHSREEMIEWWTEISKRAQSSTFTQPGEGISRSGSVMKSSSVIHPTPAPADHTQGPSPPYAPIASQVAPPVPAPAAVAAAPASPVLERLPTGSTVSVNNSEPAAAATPAPLQPTAIVPIPVASQYPLRSLSPEELLEQSQVLDDLMDDIGMGKFQKQLLMWLQCIALILPRVQAQFEIRDQYIGILSSSMFVGMMFGAMFWGTLSDIYGRKQAFNFTLIVTTVFGIGASFANSYWFLCLLILGLGFGVGGNMPVDGALFLEFTPKKNQYLLTFLSIFFSFGAVATSFLGYFLLPPYSCETPVEGGCQGKGWRYMLLAMGGMTLSMVVGRVLLFRLEESPKYLLNNNRNQEAAVVLCRIYKINHRETQSEAFDENIETLTLKFNRPVTVADGFSSDESSSGSSASESDGMSDIDNLRGSRRRTESSNGQRIRRQPRAANGAINHHRPSGDPNGPSFLSQNKSWVAFQRFRRRWRYKIEKAIERLQPLFVPEFRLSTILIWIIWALVAFAYTAFNVFYPKFLQEHGQGGHEPLQLVYMDILIYAAAGVPGSVLATVMVEGRLGRRYTMAVSTFGTAMATILFAVLSSRAAMTTFSAILSLLSTLNYAVLYSYTPEVFPSDIRGTACGVAAAMSRLAGIITPLIVGAMLTVNTYFPLYTASIGFFISAVCMCFLPIETKGRAAT
ncbi:hypothetical protein BGX23_008776 [Mortierella sp. AD031]|nr:hypothetical protein BGX23_008776 [Mortierella sp. AD031]